MNEQTKITIRELANTWGCAWVDKSGKTHYGFRDCPVSSRAQLWLECARGDAIRQLISAGLASIVETGEGTYGGETRTARVDIRALEAACDKYWDRVNAKGRAHEQRRQACFYCGQPVSKTGFFGEATCGDCS
ncbi:MAG: hypothetical protein KAJ19_25025 [Gammaproteobacteria bacterium]|nr:hypothetical protein [Gammaproteobacteria bacterium]